MDPGPRANALARDDDLRMGRQSQARGDERVFSGPDELFEN
jgi:hypothetical protein